MAQIADAGLTSQNSSQPNPRVNIPNRKMNMLTSMIGIVMIRTSTMKASTRRASTPSNSSGWAIGS